jgi:APA family basic amino acid/polyamine antiporter
MARQGVLPKVLATISRQNVPVYTILLCGVIISGIVLATRGNLNWLASIFNFGTLLTFFFINLSLLQLRKTMPDVKRGFKVPLYPYTPVFALISCIVLAFYLNANAVMTACVFLVVGIIVYYLNKKGKPSGLEPH